MYKKISRLNSDLFLNEEKFRINKPIYQSLFKSHRPKSNSINFNFNFFNNNNEKKNNHFYKVYSKDEIKKIKEKNEFEKFANFNIEKNDSNFNNFFIKN